jgi:hypothetical protein
MNTKKSEGEVITACEVKPIDSNTISETYKERLTAYKKFITKEMTFAD